ncbi:MAG: hypothetical protein RKE49_14625 [Oceanicaulis sp.]
MDGVEGELVAELLNRVQDPDVKVAFLHALITLPRLEGIRVEPEGHGYMKSLRIRRHHDWCFSLAPARRWLLLYVRKPELARGNFGRREWTEHFPGIADRGDGELTVRLTASREIDELAKAIQLSR